MEQRSSDWFRQRLGRFTASRITDLMGVKGLGQTGESYAFKLATEIVFGRDEEQIETWDMKRGNELEPKAFDLFCGLHPEYNVQPSEFFPFGDNAGASPDGLIGFDSVLEIKCPRPEKFFRLIAEGESAIDKGYIHQMQMQMMCTNSERAHFFNYIEYNAVPMWHEIIIQRDEQVIELIKQRIDEAAIIRDEFVQYFLTEKQF
jgi:putative phage-type endonuclease